MLKKIILFLPLLFYAGPPMLSDDPDVPNYGEFEINFTSEFERGESTTLTVPIVDNPIIFNNILVKNKYNKLR